MKDEKPLVKIDPGPGAGSEFSKTAPISRKAVFEDIPRHGRACLEISLPDMEPVTVELDEDDVLIGRGPNCRIQLQLNDTSRIHAKISFCNEEYEIEDLDSTNGTYVNGVSVRRCVLRNNDQIRIGDARILFIEENTRKET